MKMKMKTFAAEEQVQAKTPSLAPPATATGAPV